MSCNVSIEFSNQKTCFCQLSTTKTLAQTGDLVVIKAIQKGQSFFLCSDSCQEGSGNNLKINGLLANKLGISSKEQAHVEVCPQPKICISALVEPLSTDDWEIIELNANYIQSNLMNQVRVVWNSAVLPVWVSGNICVFIRISNLEPRTDTCLLLHQLTELIISPRGARRHKSQLSVDSGIGVTTSPSKLDSSNRLPSVSSTNQITELPSSSNQRNHQPIKEHSPTTSSSVLGNQPSPDIDSPLEEDSSISHYKQSTDSMSNSLTQQIFYNVKQWLWADNTRTSQSIGDQVDRFDVLTSPHMDDIYTRVKISYNTDVASNACLVPRKLLNSNLPDLFLASISLLLSPIEYEQEERLQAKIRRKNNKSTSNIKACKPLGTVLVRQCEDNSELLLTESFCRIHRIKSTSRIKLSTLRYQSAKIKQLQIQPTHPLPSFLTKNLIVTAFKIFIQSKSVYDSLLLNKSNMFTIPITAEETADFLVLTEPKAADVKSVDPNSTSDLETSSKHNQPDYFLLSHNSLSSTNIEYETYVTSRCNYDVKPECLTHCPAFTQPSGCEDEFTQSLNYLTSSLYLSLPGALLVTSDKGNGKTTTCKCLIRKLYTDYNYYVHYIPCKSWKGKRGDTLLRELGVILNECKRRQPSLLVLDDLDSITRSMSGPEDEMNPEYLYSSKIAHVIIDLLYKTWSEINNQVSVVCTALSRDSLNRLLTSRNGDHFFQRTIEIPPLKLTQISSVLRSLFDQHDVTQMPCNGEILEFSKRLDGYVCQDLVSLVNRALHSRNIVTKAVADGCITIHDLEAALVGFIPSRLRTVTLHTPGQVSWKDVGGLTSVKQELVKMLQWPTKYAELYSRCPIRLQTGVLLYGAPGTGKTMLAAAVAQEMSLNFISIKGPELLNKYIGASEKAVRDTFIRAESARPCVLFFDEFESLAPRRGHDSTGVTDRVVNQLLTQLDGVETLQGVYVMAATSRPDLIDAALLRPGRLDKSLLCDIPTYEERFDILKAVTGNLVLSHDVELKTIAEKCEQFTGADIKALLVNAQLEAIHTLMDETERIDKSITPDSTDSGMSNSPGDDNSESRTDSSQSDYLEGFIINTSGEKSEKITNHHKYYNQLRRLAERETSHEQSHRQSELPSHENKIVITQKQLLNALNDTHPSISEKERAKYDYIYKKFSGDVKENSPMSEQRVSLA